jgi:phosphosulfolactate phosphohydrolase-like enzyme
MKHLIEFLLCSTIGTYCLWRAASVLPGALAEAHAVVRMATERRREIDEMQEEATGTWVEGQ